jgi:hypothetical protein
MLAYRLQHRRLASMHIVIIAWLFVFFTVALTLGALEGIAFFLVAGVAPVALYVILLVRRRATARARRAPPQ